MLHVRPFVKDVDEPIWVEILNAAYREHEAWWRATTVEEMLLEERRPNFDFEGRYIAELGGKPVGIVHAHVDRLRKEKKGFIFTLCVMPEFRGLGVEEELAETAINELKTRGMIVVQTWTDYKRTDRIQLLKELGFEVVRRESDMEMDLANIPSNIGENAEIVIRTLRKDVEEDIKLLNRLNNECFRDHFNYRPSTLEETRHHLLSDTRIKQKEYFFAALDRETVGYIGVGIDEKYNIEKNVKNGFILSIGVLKPYRRKGIGTSLMLQGLKSLQAREMTKAMLDVDNLNPTNAINLYEKIGFQVIKKYQFWEKPLCAHTSDA